MNHYEHLRNTIVPFFKAKGIDVELEPFGSRGPDVVGINTTLIGEVKHEKELCRDLPCAYWSNWNSAKQKFGGKTLSYKLAEHIPDGVGDLSDRAKGWIAVVYGQIKYMARDAGLSEAWIVYENYYAFETSLLEAAAFLSTNNLIMTDPAEHQDNIGFIRITFLE